MGCISEAWPLTFPAVCSAASGRAPDQTFLKSQLVGHGAKSSEHGRGVFGIIGPNKGERASVAENLPIALDALTQVNVVALPAQAALRQMRSVEQPTRRP
ncbi:MAG: hypothetical protein JO052_13065 [Bradyrhizobium sp.]|nr:hypothetical protein [Bradyrhizobium sp.]